jgi:hypothetical protein
MDCLDGRIATLLAAYAEALMLIDEADGVATR